MSPLPKAFEFGPRKLYANLGRAAIQNDDRVFVLIWPALTGANRHSQEALAKPSHGAFSEAPLIGAIS